LQYQNLFFMESHTSSMLARNRIFITGEQQEKIGRAKILLAGAGLGSVIAETLLRTGFQNITVIDRDKVEMSHLNRQNYTQNDVGKDKVDALKKRLMKINPLANIRVENVVLTEENMKQYIVDCDYAVNTIDFNSDLPFVFDKKCVEMKIPALHPYNLGWAAALILINEESEPLTVIHPDYRNFEPALIEHIIEYCKKYHDNEPLWLRDVLKDCTGEPVKRPYPKLSVGAALAAALSTLVTCRIALNRPVRVLPEIYYLES